MRATPEAAKLPPLRPTLLIIDDHRTLRETATALLEADGFDVVGDAPDGTSGIAAVLNLRPEIVLLDVRLPDIDGFTVASRLAEEFPAAAVVMMSSSDDPLYPELARQSKARGFVAKHDISGAALQALLG